MKKAELIELFGESLRGGDNSDDTKQKYHPEVLTAYLDLALENINGSKLVRGSGSYDSEGLDVLTRTLDCVPIDCVKGRNGFDMPPFQNLPYGSGIRVITPSGSYNNFFWVSSETLYNTSNLQVFKEGKWFTISGQRVTLHNLKPKDVTVVYIPKLMDLDDDDEVSFLEGSGVEVFQLGKQLLREHKATKVDNTNQGNPDTE